MTYWSLVAHWTGRVGSKPHTRPIIQCLFSRFSCLYFFAIVFLNSFCLCIARLRGCEATLECLTMRYLGGAHSKVDWGKLPARMLVFKFTALVVLPPGWHLGAVAFILFTANCMTRIRVAVCEKGCRGCNYVIPEVNAASGFQAPDPSRVLYATLVTLSIGICTT